MAKPIISVRNISKVYRLGEIGVTSLREEVARNLTRLKKRFTSSLRSPSANCQLPTANSAALETDFWALRDVSFDVQQGEIVGIIGKNGAGKSTLLKVISRITEPTSGEIRLRGRVAALLEVGTGFHPELTGRENIYLNGTILGMKKREIDAKLDEIIDFSGIEKHIDTPVKRYSSGMNVRLGFAVAAHLEPEILIVDEVLAVGDAEFQKKCLGKMQDVAVHGRTVLFVSHNMAAVENLCSRAILIETGTIKKNAETSNVISKYFINSKSKTQLNDKTEDDHREGFWIEFLAGTCEQANCSEPLSFKYRIHSPIKLQNASTGFVIKTAIGQPVVGMSSKLEGVISSEIKDNWIVTSDLGRVPLNSGNYTLSVYFGNRKEDLAIFSDCYQFEIKEKAVLSGVHTIPQSWGNFYWVPKWEIT